MSYDLFARKDAQHSEKLPRSQVHDIIGAIPDVEPSGPAGFVLKQGDEVYMEIDVDLVSEEGDSIGDLDSPSAEVNRVDFHVPYGFADGLDSSTAVAQQITKRLGWELYDPQGDSTFGGSKTAKPWWKFW